MYFTCYIIRTLLVSRSASDHTYVSMKLTSSLTNLFSDSKSDTRVNVKFKLGSPVVNFTSASLVWIKDQIMMHLHEIPKWPNKFVQRL